MAGGKAVVENPRCSHSEATYHKKVSVFYPGDFEKGHRIYTMAEGEVVSVLPVTFSDIDVTWRDSGSGFAG